MRDEFLQEVRDSLYVHRPLPLHRERSLEAAFPGKKVLSSKVLYGDGSDYCRQYGVLCADCMTE